MSLEYSRANSGVYKWSQCRFCGRAQDRDCKPVECLLCGSRVCHGYGSKCRICLYGWIPGWHRPGGTEGGQCSYKGCERDAVANATRTRRVCVEHAKRAKVHGVTLAEYVVQRIAHRDSGKGWEQWRYIEMKEQQK
jgi:hypothetical protein